MADKLIRGFYQNGDYHKYGDRLYTTTGSNTDGSMSQKAVTEEFNSIDNTIYDISKELSGNTEEVTPDSWTDGKRVLYNTGNLENSISTSSSNYVDVSRFLKILYLRIKTTTSSDMGMAFYNESKQYISGQHAIVNQTTAGSELTELAVPEGAKYARFTYWTDTVTYGNFSLTGYLFNVIKDSKIDAINESLDENLFYDSEEISETPESVPVTGTWTTKRRVRYDTGVLEGATTLRSSDYIDLTGYGKIQYLRVKATSSSEMGMAFYDASMRYISGQKGLTGQAEGGTVLTEIAVPSNAKYARFSAWMSTSEYYTPFVLNGYPYVTVKHSRTDRLDDDVEEINSSIDSINETLASLGHDEVLNLTQQDIVEGNVINNNGTYSSMSGMGCTDFIPCRGAETLSYERVTGVIGAGLAFYDSSKQYISESYVDSVVGDNGMVSHTVTIPDEAYYFRTSGWGYANSLNYGSFSASLISSYVVANGKRASNGESTFFSVVYNRAIDDLTKTDFSSQSQVRNMVCTTGVVLLPPNYSHTGKPSRVIINFHGWSHYVHYKQWGAAGDEYAGFMKQKNRWANAGYAVIDVNHKNSSQGSDYSGLGSIQDDECYRRAYEWVKANYNVEDTCFIACGSAGGPNGINACYNWPDVRASVWLDTWIDVAQHPYPNTCGNYYYGYSGSYDASKVGTRNPITRIKNIGGVDYLQMPRCPVKLYKLSNDDGLMKPFVDIINAGHAIGDWSIRLCSGITHSNLVSGGDGTDPQSERVDNEIINYFDQR